MRPNTYGTAWTASGFTVCTTVTRLSEVMGKTALYGCAVLRIHIVCSEVEMPYRCYHGKALKLCTSEPCVG